jgi:hypothetical protein
LGCLSQGAERREDGDNRPTGMSSVPHTESLTPEPSPTYSRDRLDATLVTMAHAVPLASTYAVPRSAK